ncbi:MAG TPA: hypothetical protein VLF39_03950 [Candidatus Saccharimonadales bacterium]|nr:hypothetical protein [Candidatus Saccharimonadales bacterium]
MPANQPPPAPPPVSGGPAKPLDPYGFLAQQPAKKKGGIGPNLPSGNSVGQRVLVVLGIIVFLVVAVLIFLSILSSAGKESTAALLDVVKKQTELIRVADLGTQKASQDSTQNLAFTVKYSLESDQPDLISAIKGAGTKVTEGILNSGHQASTDATLDQAEQDNNYDAVFIRLLNTQLRDYQAALKKAYGIAKSQKLKASINSDYGHINIIIGEPAK